MSPRSLTTQCCISGGGPAGLMLGFLLARAGIDVIVMEKHADFLRDFRGDTIHPSTIDLLDQLGLREQFLELPHDDITTLDVVISGNRIQPIDFRRLHGRTRFLALMPQWDFLNFISSEAEKYPNFRLMVSTEATGLLRDGDRVVGATARDAEGDIEIRADLTVAADGRDSVLRAASALVAQDLGVAIDVLWFTLPKPQNSPPETLAYIDKHSMVITIPRGDNYQAGLVIPKGGFTEIQKLGLDAFRTRLTDTAAFLEPVVSTITEWKQVKQLSVQVNRLSRWYQAGLLCIGDAAHAMSPAFGVGVNYAIQDAVATANILAASLKAGTVTERDLARVQRRRMWPVKRMQPIQLLLHRTIARPGSGVSLSTPPPLRIRMLFTVALPIARRVAARLIGRGFRPERVSRGLQELSATTEKDLLPN